jgi:hypothetical protein
LLGSPKSAAYVDGIGENARFNYPHSVIFDSNGNVLVTDASNHCIRKVSPSGVVTTLAGNGKEGLVNGTGKEAMFNEPRCLCLASDGSILVCDSENHVLRYVSMLHPFCSLLACLFVCLVGCLFVIFFICCLFLLVQYTFSRLNSRKLVG